MKLHSFHLFQKFCHNLVSYTMTMDEHIGQYPQGQKEEDVVSNLLLYEMMRMYADRQHRSLMRTQIIQKMLECCKSEFIGRSAQTQQTIDSLVLGNYHERREGACVKYTQVLPNMFAAIKTEIRKKLQQNSNNQFLDGFLETPNSIREIFRLSRILFKDMQHLILVGPSGGGKLEYLQLAAVLNDALIYELNCSRFCESFAFIKAFKKAIVSANGLNRSACILINETQLRDPIYIDFVHNYLQNMCNRHETTVLWSDLEFKQSLIEIERDLHRKATIKRAAEPSEDILFIQALRKMQKNIHIVLLIDDFQAYFEWVSLFPALESQSDVIYMDELSTEGYRQLTSNFFLTRGADNALFKDQKLSSALVELRQIVKNNLVNLFYSPQMLKNTCTEDYMATALTEFIFSTEEKLNAYLYADGNFRLSDPAHRQYNYNLPVDVTSLYKSRYIMYLELFRYLYDFLSMGLLVRRNYYEAFLRKAAEFTEFFKDIKITKSTLHSDQVDQSSKVAAMKDRVAKLRALIEERESLIAMKTVEQKEVKLGLTVNQDEVDRATEERDLAINEVLAHIEKITGSEFIYVLSNFSKFTEPESKMLDTIAILIEKNSKTPGYQKKDHNEYFADRDELIGLLDDRRYFNFDESCFLKFKDFISIYTAADYKDKPLFTQLYHYFVGLYKKLNLRNSMAHTYSRLKQFTQQLEHVQFTLNYSKNFIKEKKQELEEMQARFEQLVTEQQQLSLKIEEAEISHMRTDHIILSIEKYAQKILGKLTKTQKRIETLLGDSLILAASVVFLGAFSMKERKIIRKEMADYLAATTGGFVKCGVYWTEKGGMNNSKLLRSILKEYGVGGSSAEDKILSNLPQGIISQENLIESIFTLMFAPSCPYVVDPTGYLQDFFSNQLLSKVQVRKLYASDQGINQQIESAMRSQSFAVLNDLNDCSSTGYGLCQDESLLSRLAHITHNGFEFDPEALKNPHMQALLHAQSVHTTHTSVNKRISVTAGDQSQLQFQTPQQIGHMNSQGSRVIEDGSPSQPPSSYRSQQPQQPGDQFSFYQIQIFSPRFDFTQNSDYMARATMLVAIDDDELTPSILNPKAGLNSAWIDIKELMLRHFLPEECLKLREIKDKIRRLERRRSNISKNFENAFLVANQETLQKISEYSQLKQSVEDIRFYEEEKRILGERFQAVLSTYPLLSSYANVIFILFQSLKKLSKVTGEITYSWRTFTSIIDQVLAKTMRDVQARVEARHQGSGQKSSTSILIDAQGRLALRSMKPMDNHESHSQIDFTLDEEFFSTHVIPQIYGVMQASVKVHLHSLLNLLFAIKIAFKKKEVSEAEVDYFFKQLFLLKNFETWRDIESPLVDMEDRVQKTTFLSFKRELIKLYPEFGRRVIDIIEKDINQSFLYKQANHTLNFKVFSKGSEFSKLKLLQQINIGFICPDHEFKTKLTQLVYEQLSSVFKFSETPIKLHEYVKVASWPLPIALIPHSSINTINTVCTIATYYGVTLEILRSSELHNTTSDPAQEHQNENLQLKNQVQSQLNDYTHGGHLDNFTKDAATYQRDAYQDLLPNDRVSHSVVLPKINIETLHRKDALRQDEKAIMGAYLAQDPLEVVERCALQGNWVFISAMRFPSYWHRVDQLLERLRAEGRIKHAFRLFYDLQGFQQAEIPDSFLFDYSASFHLTALSNSEVINNAEDIWSNVLDPRVLSELTQYQPVFPDDLKHALNIAIVQEMTQAVRSIDTHRKSSEKELRTLRTEGQMNIVSEQQKFVKDEGQRTQYTMYMLHNQPIAEAQAKKFNESMAETDAYIAEQIHKTENSHYSDTNARRARTRKLLGSEAYASDYNTVSASKQGSRMDQNYQNLQSPHNNPDDEPILSGEGSSRMKEFSNSLYVPGKLRMSQPRVSIDHGSKSARIDANPIIDSDDVRTNSQHAQSSVSGAESEHLRVQEQFPKIIVVKESPKNAEQPPLEQEDNNA